MNLKKLFLVAAVITFIFYIIFWLPGYFDQSEMNQLDRQTYSIMANTKLLLALAFYIAYRVTP